MRAEAQAGSSKPEHRVWLTRLVSPGRALKLLQSLLPGTTVTVLAAGGRGEAEGRRWVEPTEHPEPDPAAGRTGPLSLLPRLRTNLIDTPGLLSLSGSSQLCSTSQRPKVPLKHFAPPCAPLLCKTAGNTLAESTAGQVGLPRCMGPSARVWETVFLSSTRPASCPHGGPAVVPASFSLSPFPFSPGQRAR